MEMPQISAEMQQLTDLFRGTWEGRETLYPSEWDPTGGSAHGVWTARPGADGFCLLVDYTESREGRVVYHGHGVHGWDASQGCFLAYWFDNMGGMPQSGSRARLEGNRYTYQESNPKGHTRFTYAWQDGVFTFRIERSPDGQAWAPMHDGTYHPIC